MTEPQTITSDHVRSLLKQEDGFIVLIEGRVDVVDAAQLDDDAFRGAIEVVSRDDLGKRLGDDPTDEQVGQLADSLTVAVQQTGG